MLGKVIVLSAVGFTTVKVVSKPSFIEPSKVNVPSVVNTKLAPVIVLVPVIVVPEIAPVDDKDVTVAPPVLIVPVVIKFSFEKEIWPVESVIEPVAIVNVPSNKAVFVTVKSFDTIRLFAIVTSFGNEIVNVSGTDTTALIWFEVPKNVKVCPAPICCWVDELSSIKIPSEEETCADN